MVRLKVTGVASVTVTYEYFNSSMVRLKGFSFHHKQRCLVHFNSSMVRLKGEAAEQMGVAKFYFNSSMVRLKVVSGEPVEARLP